MALTGLFSGARRAEDHRLAHALRAVPLFRSMPAQDLVAIWRRLKEVRVEAGTVLFKRGDPGDHLYIVQSGQVQIRLGIDPSGLVLRHVGAGGFIGEMALLTGAPRSADVVVSEDAVLWSLARGDFEALLASNPSVIRGFARSLADRVAEVTDLLDRRGPGELGVAGLRFGPYTAVEQIGLGGMAAVYSAVHATTKSAVAVKVLPAAWGAAPELQARLAREAAVLRALAHPNVVQVLEVGQVDPALGGGCYLAMEWLPHGLDRILFARFPDPLPAPMALSLAEGVARGLGAVHGAGLVHRDVKPSNIMLRADGTPVLTDFGLVATPAEEAGRQRLTPTNVFVGTADYLAPEVVAGTRAGPRSDLYSLGIVLYEMLCGSVPFAGRAPLEALRAHVDEPPPPLALDVPPTTRAVVDRALRKDPEERFSTALEMADALALARQEAEAGSAP